MFFKVGSEQNDSLFLGPHEQGVEGLGEGAQAFCSPVTDVSDKGDRPLAHLNK